MTQPELERAVADLASAFSQYVRVSTDLTILERLGPAQRQLTVAKIS
jgi:hypothetical protein